MATRQQQEKRHANYIY